MRYFLLAAAFAALPLTALAGPREDARAGFARCDQLPEDRAWLDCVYGAVQPMRARLGLTPAPEFQQRLAAAPAGAAPMPRVAARPPMAPEPVRKSEGQWMRLAAYSFDRGGMFTVTLADGTVWRQRADDVNYAHWKEPASRYTVSVGEGLGGHGTLELRNDGNEYQVQRVR
ncbi:MAG: hypothetical protein J0H61_00530 [Alphaproteobacteria bacterium]|nr:hypothetical protein [Alphaproteobacteria bacterium]